MILPRDEVYPIDRWVGMFHLFSFHLFLNL